MAGPFDRFRAPELTGGPSSNVGSAAGVVDVGNIFTSVPRPNVGRLGTTSVANQYKEQANVLDLTEKLWSSNYANEKAREGSDLIKDAQMDAIGKAKSAQNTSTAIGTIGTIASVALALSDESTKHTVERIEDALETLRNLKPVTFYYKDEYSVHSERQHYGFIAQDYQKVMPDATYYDEELGKLCIDTGELISLLVRAIQQLETRVTRMEAAKALAGVK